MNTSPQPADAAERPSSILRQPMAVWAVAFASVVAFMGIGLVDPILPAIATELQATPTETVMLFTSYLVITGVAMFFTSWISSRIGSKKTLLFGLSLIVVFALAAGLAGDIETIIGFRAGWGLGNALFISTALATIVGAASGGTASAIILYEAALGLGLAIGPLLGGLLGSISWRGPFFGTAALMAIGFIALLVLLQPAADGAVKPAPTRLSAPFRALARPALGILAAAAVFYNFAFFVLLAYTPFALVPLGVSDAISLGLVFFGWGVSVAITSVWVAPILTRRMPRTRVLWLVLPLLAIDLLAMALFIDSLPAVIVGIVVGGMLLGVLTRCSPSVSWRRPTCRAPSPRAPTPACASSAAPSLRPLRRCWPRPSPRPPPSWPGRWPCSCRCRSSSSDAGSCAPPTDTSRRSSSRRSSSKPRRSGSATRKAARTA